jgi:Type IV secretion system proteins
MRKILLATVAVIGPAWHAQAQVIVEDPKSILQQIQNFTKQIHQMQQDFQVYTGIYTNLLSAINPNAIASELMSVANPMPGAGQIAGLITGGSGGMNLGSITSMISLFSRANTNYLPTSTGAGDFTATLLGRQSTTLSNVQGLAQQSLTSIQSHITALNDIQSALTTAKTEADLTGVSGRLTAEQANLTAQGVQIAAISAMAQTQQQQYEAQVMQQQRRDADELMQSVGGSTVDAPAGTPVSASAVPDTFGG